MTSSADFLAASVTLLAAWIEAELSSVVK